MWGGILLQVQVFGLLTKAVVIPGCAIDNLFFSFACCNTQIGLIVLVLGRGIVWPILEGR